jgi:hypothetical protein
MSLDCRIGAGICWRRSGHRVARVGPKGRTRWREGKPPAHAQTDRTGADGARARRYPSSTSNEVRGGKSGIVPPGLCRAWNALQACTSPRRHNSRRGGTIRYRARRHGPPPRVGLDAPCHLAQYGFPPRIQLGDSAELEFRPVARDFQAVLARPKCAHPVRTPA